MYLQGQARQKPAQASVEVLPVGASVEEEDVYIAPGQGPPPGPGAEEIGLL
jgi:hypothetical protein